MSAGGFRLGLGLLTTITDWSNVQVFQLKFILGSCIKQKNNLEFMLFFRGINKRLLTEHTWAGSWLSFSVACKRRGTFKTRRTSLQQIQVRLPLGSYHRSSGRNHIRSHLRPWDLTGTYQRDTWQWLCEKIWLRKVTGNPRSHAQGRPPAGLFGRLSYVGVWSSKNSPLTWPFLLASSVLPDCVHMYIPLSCYSNGEWILGITVKENYQSNGKHGGFW